MAASSKNNSTSNTNNKATSNGDLDPLWQNLDWCVVFFLTSNLPIVASSLLLSTAVGLYKSGDDLGRFGETGKRMERSDAHKC